MKYDEIKKFKEWVHFAYNFKLNGVDGKSKTMWFTEFISLSKDSKNLRQDVSRHAIFYVHESKYGGFYTVVNFDRQFRDNKISYLFNYLFMAYHFIFLGGLFFLVRMHNKRFSKGEVSHV